MFRSFFKRFVKLQLPPLKDDHDGTGKGDKAFQLIHINKGSKMYPSFQDRYIKLIHSRLPCPPEKLTELAKELERKKKIPADLFWRIYFWILLSDQRLKLIYLMRTRNAERRFKEDDYNKYLNCNNLYKTFDILDSDDDVVDEDEDEEKEARAYQKLLKKMPFHKDFHEKWEKSLLNANKIVELVTGQYYNSLCNVYNIDSVHEDEDVLLLQDKRGVLVSFVYIEFGYYRMIGIRGSVRNMDMRIVDTCSLSKIMYAGAALVSHHMKLSIREKTNRFYPNAPIGGARKMIAQLLKSNNKKERKLGLMMRGVQDINVSFLWNEVINKCKAIESSILMQKKSGDVEFVTLTQKKKLCEAMTVRNRTCKNTVAGNLSVCRMHKKN